MGNGERVGKGNQAMKAAAKNTVRPKAAKNRNNVVTVARRGKSPAGSLTQAQRIAAANRYRENYNPVAGLDIKRARALIESYARGEYADLMWAYGAPMTGIETADPDLLALIERRTSALLEFDWQAKIADKSKRRAGWDKTLAEEQQAALYEAYDRIDNIYEGIEHLELAAFRGFSLLEKHRDFSGEVAHLEVLDHWHVVRDGWAGAWRYNPEARATRYANLPEANTLDMRNWLLHEVPRMVNRFALVKFIRSNLSEKDWDAFIEIYGVPGGVVIGPPNVPEGQETEYRENAARISEGGTGYLPNGSTYEPNDGPRGLNPFRDRLSHLSEKLVLAGTGGLLTMLTAPGSGTLAGSAHQEAFDLIARARARRISEVFQRGIDAEFLGRNFPGRPRLAYFAIAANEETDAGDAVGHVVSLAGAGYMTDPTQVRELSGYKVELAKADTGGRAPDTGKPRAVLNRASREDFYAAAAADMAPLADRLEALLALRGADFEREARKLRADLPGLLEQIDADPASAEVLAEILGEDFLEGMKA